MNSETTRFYQEPRVIAAELFLPLILELAEQTEKIPVGIKKSRSWKETFRRGYRFHPTCGIKVSRKADLGKYYLPIYCQVTGERLSSNITGQFCMQNTYNKEKLFVGINGKTHLEAIKRWEVVAR